MNFLLKKREKCLQQKKKHIFSKHFLHKESQASFSGTGLVWIDRRDFSFCIVVIFRLVFLLLFFSFAFLYIIVTLLYCYYTWFVSRIYCHLAINLETRQKKLMFLSLSKIALVRASCCCIPGRANLASFSARMEANGGALEKLSSRVDFCSCSQKRITWRLLRCEKCTT